VKILGYRGKSITSRLIQLQTRSPYSHIAVMLGDGGATIEAWQGTGVRQIPDPLYGHSKGTEIDVFRITEIIDTVAAVYFLRSKIGKKYDYQSVFRFMSRRKANNNNKLFCSELAEQALIDGGLQLLNGNPSEHSPRDTLLSPYLEYERTIK